MKKDIKRLNSTLSTSVRRSRMHEAKSKGSGKVERTKKKLGKFY